MKFIEITDFKNYLVKPIFTAYCETFPENERRSEAQFESLFHNGNTKVFSILNQSKSIGYLIIWELKNFAFLEHFEIFENFRNQNFGAEVLQKIIKIYPNIILETETSSTNKMAERRIAFYQKNGFRKISDFYMQPSYGEGKESIELLLFANFSPENLERIIENIYKVVYGKN